MTVSELLVPTVPPLREDSGGVLRIGRTRVSLDFLVAAYNEGASADELAERFPTLTLGDIHATLGFYHQNRADLDAYLEHARTEEDRLQLESAQTLAIDALREQIVARRAVRLRSGTDTVTMERFRSRQDFLRIAKEHVACISDVLTDGSTSLRYTTCQTSANSRHILS